MDEDPDYKPGDRHSPSGPGREAGIYGCLGAFLFAVPAGFLLLLGIVMGDCLAELSCHQNDDKNLLVGLAIIVAPAALLGFAVRVLMLWARLRGTDSAPGAWSLAWAIPVALVLGSIAIWCALNFISLM